MSVLLAETYTGLLADPAHIGFELTLEALTGLLVYPLARFVLARVRRRFVTATHAEIDAAHGIIHGCPTNPTSLTVIVPQSAPTESGYRNNVRVFGRSA